MATAPPLPVLEETPDISTDLPTDVTTEVYTEVNTEVITDVNTEVNTEVSTDLSTEVYTEVNTEVSTDLSTEVSPAQQQQPDTTQPAESADITSTSEAVPISPLPAERESPPPPEEVVSKRLKTEPPVPCPPSLEAVLFRSEWAPNSNRETVIDRVRGCVYGNALGDAMGLATEFMSKEEVGKYYKKSGPIQFSDIVQDFHRSRWQQGDWTDDTDQMLLILEGIVESGGKVVPSDFANKLYKWAGNGFPELGDAGGLGIGMTVHRTISHKNFLADPHTAAMEVWERSGKYLAANGAVMRTSVLGLLSFNCIETVIRNTLDISLTTHADPRCSASCVAVTTLISQLLQCSSPCSKDELSNLVARSIQVGAELIEEEEKKAEFVSHMKLGSFQALKLDEAKAIGYTLKCAGTAFVGVNSKVKSGKEFLKLMTELVREAGDADTNGAVCGAVVGCKIGYSNLPHDWLQKMPHIKWLDEKVEQFLNCIGLGPEEKEITAV